MSVRMPTEPTQLARDLLPFIGIVMVALITVLFASALGTVVLV